MTIRQINVVTKVETSVPDTRIISEEAISEGVRVEREEKLRTEVDPIASHALRWVALSPAEQAAMAVYRQELLDVPQQAGFPKTHTWPTKP